MAVRSRWQRLPTEAVNPLSRDIDLLTTDRMVQVMLRDHQAVLPALRREGRWIARAAEVVAASINGGGRLILVGAGTSGRLGVLEAAELPPTFGVNPNVAVAVIAGGNPAVRRAREGVEDDYDEGVRALRQLRAGPQDVVIGISASGVTPFVRGAVVQAGSAGARIVSITCDPRSALKDLAHIPIVLRVGPEVIAGSTRLKAGTAQKLVLNMLSTISMIRLGKTFGNLMVDVRASNEKLRARVARVVREATGAAPDEVERALAGSGGDAKQAIVSLLAGVDAETARERLRAAGGDVRAALAE
jgi:N-acetylmuramic acid 6-phosphate etherase